MIRTACSEDVTRLHALSGALVRSSPLPRDVVDREIAAALADPRSVLLVAESRDQVVGYLLAVLAPMLVYGGLAFVQELYVEPDHRGAGLGRALLERFAAVAAERGSRVAALATSRAGAFYEHLGWEPSPTYYRRSLVEPADRR